MPPADTATEDEEAQRRKRERPSLTANQIADLREELREMAVEQAYSLQGFPADDLEVDDDWIDWVESYEDAIEGLGKLGIDPYEDPLAWIEFLDPLGEFEPTVRATADDTRRFLTYLADTYGFVR